MLEINTREVGTRVRQQRISLGYTREQLAEQLNVSPKFCSDIELGYKGMSLQTLAKMAQTLRVTTDYLLFGTPPQASEYAAPISAMLERCPPEKAKYAQEILRIYLSSLD